MLTIITSTVLGVSILLMVLQGVKSIGHWENNSFDDYDVINLIGSLAILLLSFTMFLQSLNII